MEYMGDGDIISANKSYRLLRNNIQSFSKAPEDTIPQSCSFGIAQIDVQLISFSVCLTYVCLDALNIYLSSSLESSNLIRTHLVVCTISAV